MCKTCYRDVSTVFTYDKTAVLEIIISLRIISKLTVCVCVWGGGGVMCVFITMCITISNELGHSTVLSICACPCSDSYFRFNCGDYFRVSLDCIMQGILSMNYSQGIQNTHQSVTIITSVCRKRYDTMMS